MLIRNDEINRIAIDRFTSASGSYEFLLCTRFERGYNVLHIVAIDALTKRVLKVVALGVDSSRAYGQWEYWRKKFATIPDGATYETDAPTALSEIHWSPPILIKEDLIVLKMNPVGSQIFVRDITPVDQVTARAEAAGLKAVVAEENKPRPTMGIVLKFGPDPFLREQGFNIGDIVMFSRHAGGPFMEAGYEYRHIQPHEVIGWRDSHDDIDDLLPPNLPQEMIDWARDLLPTLIKVAESKPIVPVTTDYLKETPF